MYYCERKGWLNLIAPEEMILFIKELSQLINDYERCTERDIKAKINSQILFLSEVIEADLGSYNLPNQ